MRTLILGPLQSPKYVHVTEEFYSQSKGELKDGHELVFRAEMNADSSRRVALTLHHLKLFAKVDILFILQTFFTDSFPDYTHRQEKPSGYDADPANYAR